MYDVLTIGSATRDVFLVSKHFIIINSDQFPTGQGECVSFGSKIEIEKVVHSTGGGATNAAVTFARLGFKTSIICKVGKDQDGDDVINDLQKENIATSLIRRTDSGATGYSTILTTLNGERSVLVHRGVSADFQIDDILWERCNTKCIYLTSLGGNIALTKKIIDHANKNNIFIAWNPGSKELKKGWKILSPLFSKVDVLLLNLEEAQFVAEKSDADEALGELAAAVENKILLVTEGEEGAYTYQNKEWFYTSTTGKKAISRTGAGDAFGSGFVAAWQKSEDIKYSLATATINAESVIQSFGAKTGILSTWPNQYSAKKIKTQLLN